MSLNIGIIGTGGFSKVHGDILAGIEDVQVAAICGTSMEKAQNMASAYPGAKSYAVLTEMLDAQKLDAVYICVPPMSHGEIETELISRGIPFFVEKPLGMNLDIPMDILDRLNQKPLINSVGYHFRYIESVQLLRELLQGRTIGMALGTWMGGMPGVAWWRRQEGSGGQFIEQTTHIVDLLRYTAGEVAEVYAAYGNRVVQNKYENVNVPDVGTVTLKLKSGAVANISNTCILPSGVGKSGLSLYTDGGILDWNQDRLEVIEEGVRTAYTSGNNPYVSETEAFIHALRTGDTSRILSDYADAVKTQRVTYAALESALTGNPVKITD